MFGNRHRSKKVELTCPHCGFLQQEPSLVLSTFCRSCGEHYRVRKGVAFAAPGLRVSGITEVKPHRRDAGADRDSTTPATVPSDPPRAESPDVADLAGKTEISAGAFFGLVPESEVALASDPPTDDPLIGTQAQSRQTLGQGTMAALIGSQQPLIIAEKEKMPPNYQAPDPRRRREDSTSEIPVRCFRCDHIQNVSRHAKSTQCERCSDYISLSSYEIKTVKSHSLRTRGDIIIGKKGGLIRDSEIACHHLTVNGQIDATVDCSGIALFRHTGTVRGRLHCEKLVIEKGCEIRFPDGVMARQAEITGRLVGDATVSGKVRLARTGVIEGNLAAVELDLKEGGIVTGETVLDPETSSAPPLRRAFDPSVIG